MDKNWVAIDWGTTNFRAFLMSETGICVDKIEASKGLLSINDRQFSESLNQLLGAWHQSRNIKSILMAGMVGSKQGWVEAPYIEVPATPASFIKASISVDLDWGGVAQIISGACCNNKFDLPDVMRGEEVQLIGLANLNKGNDFFAILNGTHSKHAIWKDGLLHSFNTIMTGELFSILTNYSILGKGLPKQSHDEAAFIVGVDIGNKFPINQVLFSARTLQLFNKISPQYIESYISGLLIGSELSELPQQTACFIVGSQSLSEHYFNALKHLGHLPTIADGDECFLIGMTELYQLQKEVNNDKL
mgnify:CR=1 FL=1